MSAWGSKREPAHYNSIHLVISVRLGWRRLVITEWRLRRSLRRISVVLLRWTGTLLVAVSLCCSQPESNEDGMATVRLIVVTVILLLLRRRRTVSSRITVT